MIYKEAKTMNKGTGKRRALSLLSLILCILTLLPCFGGISLAGSDTKKAKAIDLSLYELTDATWDFSDNTEASDFKLFASADSSLSIANGALDASGANGEMKAVLNRAFESGIVKSVSVDIIPASASGAVNAGIYVGASDAKNEAGKINALAFILESKDESDPARIDIVTKSFPSGDELARVASNSTKGNAIYEGSSKKPVNLMLTFDDNNITATISLVGTPTKYAETVYLCDTAAISGQIGLAALGSDVSFDNLKVEYFTEKSDAPGTDEPEKGPDAGLILPGRNEAYATSEKPSAVIPNTVEAWVWVSSNTDRLLTDADGTTKRTEGIISGYSERTQDPAKVGDWNFDICKGKLRWVDKTSKGKSGQLWSTVQLPNDEWIHIAVTRENGKVSFYVNGEAAGTANYTKYEESTVATTPITFGFSKFDTHQSFPSYLDGAIREVRLWRETRTGEQIKADMNKTLAGNEAGLMNYWKFDKTEENKYKDSTSAANSVVCLVKEETNYTNNGINNPDWVQLQTVKDINDNVRTMEAWVKVPTAIGNTSRLTIASGFPQTNCHMDVYTNGRPRLYYTSATGKAAHFMADADLRTNKWTHIAWVVDDVAKSITCYINGKESFVSTNIDDSVFVKSLYIGRDNRSGWQYPFMGEVADIRVWNKALSAEEVKYSMMTENIGEKEGLLLNLPLDEPDGADEYRDLSGNKNNVVNREFGFAWINVEKKPSDYSIAIIPDQQYLTATWVDTLNGMYTWIGDNVEKENIKMVINLGDITDNNSSEHWRRAKHAHSLLGDKVPCLYVAGNHDYGTPYRNLINMNNYFPLSMFKKYDTYGGSYSEDKGLKNDVANIWQEFEVGGIKYLLLSLEFGPRDKVLEWANEVVAAHPCHQVIVATHGYMNYDGTLLDGNDTYVAPSYGFVKSDTEPANDAAGMWDKFVKKHENIIMVLSGHIFASDNIVMRTDIGDNGNEVRQFLIDAQALDQRASGLGMVAMMNFSNGGKDVEVTYYCTKTGKYLNYENQFTINVPVTNHTEETLPAKAPDCENTGLTEGKQCSECKEILVKQEVIPALGHSWVNSEDGKSKTCSVCKKTENITDTPVTTTPVTGTPGTDAPTTGEPQVDNSNSDAIIVVVISVIAALAVIGVVTFIVIKKKKA